MVNIGDAEASAETRTYSYLRGSVLQSSELLWMDIHTSKPVFLKNHLIRN